MFTINASFSNSLPKLGVGLHTVKATSVELVTLKEQDAIKWTFSNDSGVYEHVEWPPKPGAEQRGTFSNGGIQPSQLDQLLMRVNEIVMAISGVEAKTSFKDWEDVRQWCLANFVKDAVVDVKLLDLYKGNASVKKLIASVGEDGNLYVSKKKKFIGKKLFLTEEEIAKVKEMLEAKPDDLELPLPEISDLPF